MKKILNLVVIAVVIFLAGQTSTVYAGDMLSASISSQIHEAFGRDMLDVFKEASGVTVKAHVFSSEQSVKRLKNGVTDMAGSTVKLSNEDKDSGLIEIPMCKDALVIITHPSCTIKNITIKQARRLFSGSIKNWKELGGADLPVIRIIPDENTGAFKNFKRQAMGPFDLSGDLVAAKSFTAVTGVTNIPGSVSFISRGIAVKFNRVSVMNIDGVYPTDSEYPFHQIFSMVIKGKPSALIKEVIKFLTSEVAVDVMKERGIQPVLK